MKKQITLKLKNDITILHPNQLEQFNFGTWIWYSVENRILMSEEFCQMAGISKNIFATFNLFFDIVHGSDLLQFLKDIDAVLKGASPRWTKFRIVLPDNSIKQVNCFIESMSDEFADIFDITGICFEVTSKKSKSNSNGYKHELVQEQ